MYKRDLSKEEEVIRELFSRKASHQNTHAYVTTTAPITLKKWNGRHPVEENSAFESVPAGTTLKIVMVSRFGDFGLTDDLNAEHGYHVRVGFDDPIISNIRWTPEIDSPINSESHQKRLNAIE